jgi:TolA-binding protein
MRPDAHFPERFELFTQYLLGSLDETERDRLEAHLFECDECFRELDAIRVLQGELRRSQHAIRTADAHEGRSAYWGLAAAAALVAVIGGSWWLRPPTPTPAVPQAATVKAPPEGGAPARLPDTIVAQLTHIDPPRFVALTVRGESQAESDFDAGMRNYARGDYKGAIVRLERAVAQEPTDPAAVFFLGVSSFLTDDFVAAARRFEAVASLGDSPYQQPASLHLARSLIRLGRLDEAEQTLQRTARAGTHAAEAGTLLEQLRAARRRSS